MQQEIWRDIPGYSGLYQVSNLGNIRNRKGKLLRPGTRKGGYKMVILRKNKKNHQMQVHRAVAMAFLPNPNNEPIINHINENPSDNRLENLEWCNYRYNFYVSSKHENKNKKIIQKDLLGNVIAEYSSIREAARTMGNINKASSICAFIRKKMGLRKTGRKRFSAYGYIWEYAK